MCTHLLIHLTVHWRGYFNFSWRTSFSSNILLSSSLSIIPADYIYYKIELHVCFPAVYMYLSSKLVWYEKVHRHVRCSDSTIYKYVQNSWTEAISSRWLNSIFYRCYGVIIIFDSISAKTITSNYSTPTSSYLVKTYKNTFGWSEVSYLHC